MSFSDLHKSDTDNLGVMLAVLAGIGLSLLFIGLARIKALILVISTIVFFWVFSLGHFNLGLFVLLLVAFILLVCRMVYYQQLGLGQKWYGDNWMN